MLMPFLLLVTAGLSWLLSGWFIRYARRIQLLDLPKARSSHQVPTPRGGGIVMAGVFLACTALWSGVNGQGSGYWIILLAGALLALVGLRDDFGHVPAWQRLLVHLAAVVLLLLGLPLPSLPWWLWPVVVLALVWLINLYNFMDGIDGLAGQQMLCLALFFSLFSFTLGAMHQVWLGVLLAAAVSGFLYWNWPAAKVFMGDAGSGFLGIMAVVLLLLGWQQSVHFSLALLIMLGVFVVDASYTLLIRLLTGQSILQPHRLHAYQKLARRWQGHAAVTWLVLLVNLLWLLPLAWLAASGAYNPWGLLAGAYLPLLLAVVYLRAGLIEQAP